jgi:hypothetical protein
MEDEEETKNDGLNDLGFGFTTEPVKKRQDSDEDDSDDEYDN